MAHCFYWQLKIVGHNARRKDDDELQNEFGENWIRG
jgi:hypothetical protein